MTEGSGQSPNEKTDNLSYPALPIPGGPPAPHPLQFHPGSERSGFNPPLSRPSHGPRVRGSSGPRGEAPRGRSARPRRQVAASPRAPRSPTEPPDRAHARATVPGSALPLPARGVSGLGRPSAEDRGWRLRRGQLWVPATLSPPTDPPRSPQGCGGVQAKPAEERGGAGRRGGAEAGPDGRLRESARRARASPLRPGRLPTGRPRAGLHGAPAWPALLAAAPCSRLPAPGSWSPCTRRWSCTWGPHRSQVGAAARDLSGGRGGRAGRPARGRRALWGGLPRGLGLRPLCTQSLRPGVKLVLPGVPQLLLDPRSFAPCAPEIHSRQLSADSLQP